MSPTPLLSLGFLTTSGEETMRKRGIFSNFFHQENLVNIFPKMDKFIEDGVLNLKQKIKDSQEN